VHHLVEVRRATLRADDRAVGKHVSGALAAVAGLPAPAFGLYTTHVARQPPSLARQAGNRVTAGVPGQLRCTGIAGRVRGVSRLRGNLFENPGSQSGRFGLPFGCAFDFGSRGGWIRGCVSGFIAI
jgi:hypothetical protein